MNQIKQYISILYTTDQYTKMSVDTIINHFYPAVGRNVFSGKHTCRPKCIEQEEPNIWTNFSILL